MNVPAVSIGVPVYNGEATIAAALDALLGQSFADFEIIISDNASTDRTREICELFCEKDIRIKYIRQENNIGAAKNFEVVLKESQGKFFMWAAGDDLRSNDFLESNVNFLEANDSYIASMSPNYMGKVDDVNPYVLTFSLEGSLPERFDTFFQFCWKSNGIYYSLMKSEVAKGFEFHGEHYLAADWVFDIYLASRGKIKRIEEGMTILGPDGISNSSDPWGPFRVDFLGWFLPYHKFSFYTLKLTSGHPISWRLSLVRELLKINFFGAKSQFITEFYPYYYSNIIKPLNVHIRPIVKKVLRR